MKYISDKASDNKSKAVANNLAKEQNKSESTFQLVDNRSEAIVQRKLQEVVNVTHAEAPLKGNVIQRVKINGIDVTNDNGYPKWTQNGLTYHITMVSVDSMHVTEEYSRNHYHFSVDAGKVKSKRPVKGEVGGRFATHHKLDELPDKEVSDFIKNYITEIMNVK